ncbi:MAG TPA: VTT domain-containing protein [Candidatus Angelobacter sp.]|nr:VTT domain-containing protein [Candidatus Angelobacter sp.]
MEIATQRLLQHGYITLFLVALTERLGFPLFLTPFVMVAGMLAGAGKLSLGLIILFTAVPAIFVDFCWYWVGKKRGVDMLRLMCRLSLERDSCVRRTQAFTARHAGLSIVYSKFIPGISHLAPPMAGVANIEASQFLFWETFGTLLWTFVFVMAGYAAGIGIPRPTFSQILFGYVPVVVLALVVGNVAWKFGRKQIFIRSLRADRITPEALKEKLGSDDLVVIDLRHSLDVLHDPRSIPGAVHIYPEDLQKRSKEIPFEKHVVLYCT